MFFLFLFHILESVLPTFLRSNLKMCLIYGIVAHKFFAWQSFKFQYLANLNKPFFWKIFKRVGNTELDLRSCSQDVHISKWRLSFLIYYKKSFCLPTYYFFCYIVFLLSKKMCMNWIPHIAMHACMRLYFGWYICIYA